MATFRDLRALYYGKDNMDIKDKAAEVVEGADKGLTSLADIVTTKGWTKWLVAVVIVLVGAIVVWVLWPA